MKHDTTTWILLAVLLFLLLKKKAAAQSAAGAPGRAGLPGRPGASGSGGGLIQQFFKGLSPSSGTSSKPGSGVSIGSGVTPSPPRAPAPSAPASSGWRPPLRRPLPLQPSAPLTGLIPSQAPPVYNLPTMNYPGQLATIPSDTSGLYVLPMEPPSYENVTSAVKDWSSLTSQEKLNAIQANIPDYITAGYNTATGAPVDQLGSTDLGLISSDPFPTYDLPTMNYPGGYGGQVPDPTYFSPVDTQTIDTTTLGGISYLPEPSGGDIFASAGGYNPGVNTSETSGEWDYAEMAAE